MRQRQTDAVQEFAVDGAGHWRADHAADELGNHRGIDGSAKRHHHFSTRAIPSRCQRRLEEDDAHVGIVLNLGSVNLAKLKRTGGNVAVVLETMGSAGGVNVLQASCNTLTHLARSVFVANLSVPFST